MKSGKESPPSARKACLESNIILKIIKTTITKRNTSLSYSNLLILSLALHKKLAVVMQSVQTEITAFTEEKKKITSKHSLIDLI